MFLTLFGQHNGFMFFILLVIFRYQGRNKFVDSDVQLGRKLGRAGNNQRRPRFVDKDRVDFVDDGEIERPLHHLLQRILHIVAQIIKAEFVVRAVCDIGGIGIAALLIRQIRNDATGAQAHETVDLSHPVGVALGEVIIDGNHMHALAGQGIQVNGQGGDQGFTFTGLHLGDIAIMQDQPADQLDIIMTLAKDAFGGFPGYGKGLVEHAVERLAIRKSLTEKACLALQLCIAHGLEPGFKFIDRRNMFTEGLQFPAIRRAENLGGEVQKHQFSGIPV